MGPSYYWSLQSMCATLGWILCLSLSWGLLFLPLGNIQASPSSGSTHQMFGLMVDAGSSGSRLRVYTWPAHEDAAVPDIAEIYNKKVRPGVSAYADDLDGLRAHVGALLDEAKIEVPEHLHDATPIYVMATAGMRLLLESKANSVVSRINEILSDDVINPFAYQPMNTRILSGEEEGVFAWIAVNYLRGFFDPSNGVRESAGILELGGASTQIAFLPEGSILADKFPVEVGGQEYQLYVHSYLTYGQDSAQRWVQELLRRKNPNQSHYHNPCMVPGDFASMQISGHNVTFSGSGNASQCEELLKDYVYKVEPYRCYPRPCAIGPVYQPSISPDMEFYAVAAFTFYPEVLGVLKDEQGTFSMSELTQAARGYCLLNKEDAMREYHEKEEFVSMNCIMGLYMPILFTRGYRFPNDTDKIKSVKTIGNRKTDWTLGAILYEQQKRELQWACPDHEAVIGQGATLSRTFTSGTLPTLSIIIMACWRLLYCSSPWGFS